MANLGALRKINPALESFEFEWDGSFGFREILEFDEARTNLELRDFARRAKMTPQLTVSLDGTLIKRLHRIIYFSKLRIGLD